MQQLHPSVYSEYARLSMQHATMLYSHWPNRAWVFKAIDTSNASTYLLLSWMRSVYQLNSNNVARSCTDDYELERILLEVSAHLFIYSLVM